MFKTRKKIKDLEASIVNLDNKIKTLKATSKYEILEGTHWAKYLLPLEYKPSSSYQPRYGNTHPILQPIDALFKKHRSNYESFVETLFEYVPNFKTINLEFKHEALPQPGYIGGALNPMDICSIYAFVAKTNPKKYVEIGSGLSTCIAKKAINDHGLRTKIISIDPYPRCEISAVADEIVKAPFEECDLGMFFDLEEGDIVFMDGSHRTFMNSDVTVFMLEVLPKLKPGIIVHIHDISLPYDYPDFLKNFYWNEQYMVAMYLIAAADRIKPLFPVNYVDQQETKLREKLIELLKEIEGAFTQAPTEHIKNYSSYWNQPTGGSFWFTHQDTQPLRRESEK